MPDADSIARYYKTLTDEELLNLGVEGGFTVEAENVFRNELARRNLSQREIKRFGKATERIKLRDEVVERGGGYRSLGLQFFGSGYLSTSDEESRIHVRTKWFTMSGIPLIPIASYRFKCKSKTSDRSLSDSEQVVINRVPLNWPQVFLTWIKTAIIGVGLFLLGAGGAWLVDRLRH